MIDTLNIGAYIFDVLSNDEELNSLLGESGNIYPLVADNNVYGSFIVYRRTNIVTNTTKDFCYEDDTVVEITVVSNTYSNGIDIISRVRKLFEKQHIKYENLDINDTHIVSASEEFSNNMFVQKLAFAMTIS